jgi:Tol biopolymer transport system component
VVFAFLGGRPVAGVARFELASGRVELLATTSRKANLLRPSFARSGRRISLEQRGDDGSGSQLRILPFSPGAQLRRLTKDATSIDTKGFFARSGEVLFFTREPARDAGRQHRRRIYRVAASGGEARPVFEPDTSDSNGMLPDANELDEHSARPSPTRAEFTFVSNRDTRGGENDSELYIAAHDGHNLRRLTSTPNWSEHAPRWSPNGERIVVIAVPLALERPRLVEPSNLAQIRLRVFNREGELLFDELGMMADWMPPWP